MSSITSVKQELLNNPDTDSVRSSPMLKRVLSERILYAVSLPPSRNKYRLWRKHNLGLILLPSLLAVFLLVAFFWMTMTNSQNPATSNRFAYGVVFDAGSTGSRVHVFKLERDLSALTGGQYKLVDELFESVTPGLSAYANTPEKAADSLTTLLEQAQQYVPSELCTHTPVVLRATAGLRLLPGRQAEDILSAVRKRLSSTCFSKSNNSVTILDGLDEGLYLWITVNFILNRLPQNGQNAAASGSLLSRTIGTVDLGGGSTQITFAPKTAEIFKDSPKSFITSLKGRLTSAPNNQIYSHSYLGLGLMSARQSMLVTGTKRLPATRAADQLFTPCFPPGATVNWNHAGRQWIISHIDPADNDSLLPSTDLQSLVKSSIGEHASGTWALCYGMALEVLRAPIEADPNVLWFPPYNFIVHRPPELSAHEFAVFSYIYDLAKETGIMHDGNSGIVKLSDFRDTAERVCNNPDRDHPFQCFDLTYITALLHNGYGFSFDQTIHVLKKVDSFEMTWSLGALFAELKLS